MNALEIIVANARRNPKCIVLSEGEDPRVAEGAVRAARERIAQPVLIGNRRRIEDALARLDAADVCGIVDPDTSEKFDDYARAFLKHRGEKLADLDEARKALADPLFFAAMMVRQGDADGTVGGAVNTTSKTVRVALQVIGPAPGVKTVSSLFLMILDQDYHKKKGSFIFSDCGLVVEPTSGQLADIAISSAASYHALAGDVPRIAFLSFSTKGSAGHQRVDHVCEALARLKSIRPDLIADGELQFDAAFVPEIARAKAPGSELGGNANVLIFPNLEAGNIGYKIAERIGGATAIGPILQGLAKPANDLSRGCSATDVFHAIAVTTVQAAQADSST